MTEQERQKVRDYFKEHRDASRYDIEKLLDRKTSFLEMLEAGIIKCEATRSLGESQGKMLCAYRIEIGVERADGGASVSIAASVEDPKPPKDWNGDIETLVNALIAARIARKIAKEISPILNDSAKLTQMAKSAFDELMESSGGCHV